MYFTGIKDTDLLLLSYLDDVALCRIQLTCKYFDILLTNDSFWRDRLIKVLNIGTEHATSTVKSTYKYHYTQKVAPWISKFKSWIHKMQTIDKSIIEYSNQFIYEMTEISSLVRQDRLDLLLYMHSTELNKLLFDVAIKANPNLVMIAMSNNCTSILNWMTSTQNEQLITSKPLSEDKLSFCKISPLTLWFAVIAGHLSILSTYETLGILPCKFASFHNFLWAVQSHKRIPQLRNLSNDLLVSVLDWLKLHNLVDDNFVSIIVDIINDDLQSRNESRLHLMLQWCKDNKINLCIDGYTNPYADALMNINLDNPDIIWTFDLFHSYGIPLHPETIHIILETNPRLTIWLKDKGLII